MNKEQIEKTLNRIFLLGQTYWQQADSEYVSQNKKADATRDMFLALKDEILNDLALSALRPGEPVAWMVTWADGTTSPVDIDPSKHRWEVMPVKSVPLYAAPPAPADSVTVQPSISDSIKAHSHQMEFITQRTEQCTKCGARINDFMNWPGDSGNSIYDACPGTKGDGHE